MSRWSENDSVLMAFRGMNARGAGCVETYGGRSTTPFLVGKGIASCRALCLEAEVGA